MNATKKKWLLPVGAVLVVLLLIIALVTTMTGTGSEKSEFLSTFQLDTAANNVQIQEVYNDRGWFGDGTTLYQVTLGADGEALTEEWNDLPPVRGRGDPAGVGERFYHPAGHHGGEVDAGRSGRGQRVQHQRFPVRIR